MGGIAARMFNQLKHLNMETNILRVYADNIDYNSIKNRVFDTYEELCETLNAYLKDDEWFLQNVAEFCQEMNHDDVGCWYAYPVKLNFER